MLISYQSLLLFLSYYLYSAYAIVLNKFPVFESNSQYDIIYNTLIVLRGVDTVTVYPIYTNLSFFLHSDLMAVMFL